FGSLDFEVLLRSHDHKGVLVPTGTVISAAEESGIMPLIDHWVMSTTLQWLHNNQHRLNNTKFVCVNLNGMSLNDDSFVEMFFALFDRYGHVGRKLLIEITESVAVKDMERTRAFILRVQDKGAKVALDDFGAGYTSFAYLKQLPANALKIDGTFICNMNEHPTDIAIVRAIVALAKSLDMISIAEWVEDLATLRTLKELGLDYVQGYVIARPQLPELIPYALNSAGFIEDKRTRQYLSYGQPKAHAL
ncbi:MAG TPA: diguanylate cyclase, partial [Pusillimonas sp.]|nr:diguanylate cyclase [Pusillimonas sp.]